LGLLAKTKMIRPAMAISTTSQEMSITPRWGLAAGQVGAQ
jgi:hypothetical protein